MHVMTDKNPRQSTSEPVLGDQHVKRAPPPKVKAWPGGECDDDEVVADGMCDDDGDGPPAPRLPAPLGFQQSSLWNQAIARIRAARSRGGPS